MGTKLRISRLRAGERLAIAGALALLAVSFLPWYRVSGGGTDDGWDVFGVLTALMLLAGLATVWLAITTVTERSPALPIAATVWGTLLTFIGVLAAIIRLLDDPSATAGTRIGPWLALLCTVAMLVGCWLSLRDERTDLYSPVAPEPRSPA
jgi:hypothetical protein